MKQATCANIVLIMFLTISQSGHSLSGQAGAKKLAQQAVVNSMWLITLCLTFGVQLIPTRPLVYGMF